jgi:DNA-binding CsgD family transcriptional regulator
VLELGLLLEGIIIHHFALDKPLITLGRHSDNDIHIDDASVSGFHARIELLDNQKTVYLRDLQSTNGTFVNKTRINEKKLVGGDYLMVGRKQFKLIDSNALPIANDTTAYIEPLALDFSAQDKSNILQELGLSPREIQVLQLLCSGLQRKQIAQRLAISIHTTSDYVKAVYKKLQVSSRTEAVQKAQRLGLII